MDPLNRSEIKVRARAALNSQAPTFVLSYVVLSLVSGVFSSAARASSSTSFNAPWYAPSPGLVFSFSLFGLLGVAVGGVLQMGFLKMSFAGLRNEQLSVADVFAVFSDFIRAVGLVLFVTVKIFLWSLLFIVPGIIAAYRYAMAYYIYLENPDMGYTEITDASGTMMNGHKLDLFVFQFSFFWWYCLVAVTFGLAAFWVAPYVLIATTEFYNRLKVIERPISYAAPSAPAV